MPFEPSHILTEAPAEFEGKAGLSDPRVSHEENDLPVAPLGLFKTLGEKSELALSADEGREPALGSHLETRPVCPSGDDFPGGDRFSLSFDGNRAKRAGEEVSVDQAVGGLGDDYPLRLGCLLQPGRDIRGVADRGVVHSEVTADSPDNHQA